LGEGGTIRGYQEKKNLNLKGGLKGGGQKDRGKKMRLATKAWHNPQAQMMPFSQAWVARRGIICKFGKGLGQYGC